MTTFGSKKFVGAYMLAQGAVDYKNGKGTPIVPAPPAQMS